VNDTVVMQENGRTVTLKLFFLQGDCIGGARDVLREIMKDHSEVRQYWLSFEPGSEYDSSVVSLI
jgi:hypothetical protein